MSKRVQSVRFSRTESPRRINHGRGWTTYDAVMWLQANGFRGLSPLTTSGQWRFRQFEPVLGDPDTFRTVDEDLPRGIQAIVVDVLA